MPTKLKRVSRKQGFRFTLMHRSQQDPLYHDEEHGSKFILHPADRKTAVAMDQGGLEQEGALNYVSGSGTATSAKAVDEKGSKKRTQDYLGVREFREVDDYGLPLDGYDYTKHMSTIGGGAFIGSDGTRIENAFPSRVRPVEEEDDEEEEFEVEQSDEGNGSSLLSKIPGSAFASATEQPRLLEAITLRPEGMDEDMKRQLGLVEDADDDASEVTSASGEWGDLQDDFMNQLLVGGAVTQEDAEREAAAEAGQDEDAFDFDAHVARMMKQAEEEDAMNEEEEEEEDEYDAFARRARGEAPKGRAHVERPQRDVDTHFQTVFDNEYGDNDYDSDEQDLEGHEHQGEGEEDEYLDEEEEECEGVDEYGDILKGLGQPDENEIELVERESHTTLRSKRSSRAQQARRKITQDDPIFLQAINEFLDFQANDASLGDVAHPPPATETLRLIGMPSAVTVDSAAGSEATNAPKDEGKAGDDDEEEVEEEEEPTYEEFLEMWGTYQPTQKPQFDCQSIVSTRSTTDNIPSEIFIENSRAKKKLANQAKASKNISTQPKAIAEVEDEDVDDVATVESVTRDVARLALQSLSERSRKETPEERKARKTQLKELQRERRAQKKQTKEMFKREKAEVLNKLMAPGAPKPGVSEYKIQ